MEVTYNGTSINQAHLVKQALAVLGVDASEPDIRKHVKNETGIDINGYRGIGQARRWFRLQGNGAHNRLLGVPTVNGSHPVDQPQFTTIPKETAPIKPVPVAGSNVVEVIKLARLAIEAAGSKDNLKAIIDVL